MSFKEGLEEIRKKMKRIGITSQDKMASRSEPGINPSTNEASQLFRKAPDTLGNSIGQPSEINIPAENTAPIENAGNLLAIR